MKTLAALALATLAALPAQADPHPEAKRVLTIGGSVTEIVYALGQQDRLIARDTTSAYPPEAVKLPDVGYMRQLSSEGVLSVNPDLILSEEGAGPPETIAVLKEAGIPFETIPAGTDPEGLAAKIEAVAVALGVPDAAGTPVATLRADLEKLSAATDEPQKKRVMFILSVQGGRIMASGQGTEADAIIRLAGAENAITDFDGYKSLTDEAVIAAAPDVILMMDRTGGPEGTAADVQSHPALAATPAGAAGQVIRMDGMLLLGFGPRTPEAAAALYDALYPAGG